MLHEGPTKTFISLCLFVTEEGTMRSAMTIGFLMQDNSGTNLATILLLCYTAMRHLLSIVKSNRKFKNCNGTQNMHRMTN